ncbi:hypothetical protein OPQ81_004662 [Rhizoctonia solani]|nr:hypothetical protein OPQ81_004662 [Rhizoctonia solani]
MNSRTHELEIDDTPQQATRKRLAFINHIPSLRQYFQDTWLDLVVVLCVGALALGLNSADNASTRQFPIVFSQDRDVIYPTFAYPRRNSIIPIWLDALLAILIPTLFFFIAQIRVRSFYDLNTAFWGLVWAVASTTLFQVFLKTLIGGFRPHFLSVCNPDLSRIGTGSGFQGIMYDISICSPDANKAHLRDATKSFPSGHTTAAAAGYVYLSLYFNAKMKIFSNERPHFYKLLVFLAPLLGASLIGGVLTVDNSHHWYDVIAGAVIGTIGAFAAFRMSYASVWDYRFNHIPLPRPKSAWSPFGDLSQDGHVNGMVVNVDSKTPAPMSFSYTTGVPIFPSFAHPKDWCPAGAPGDASIGSSLLKKLGDCLYPVYSCSPPLVQHCMHSSQLTRTFESARRFQYEAVPSFFVQSEAPATLNFPRRPLAFGLKEHASSTRWRDLKDRINLLQQSAPEGTRYIICWLARHGQAWHNMNATIHQADPGIFGWDTLKADPPLTPLGESQAKELNDLWKAELQRGHGGDPVPLPTKLFCSPLSRALATMEITFEGVLLDKSNIRAPGGRPLVLEGLREVISPFTHDKRSSKTEILQLFPGVQTEDSFTEEDELWDPTVSESDSELKKRVKSTLDHIFGEYLGSTDTSISITTHSGVAMMILRIVGHRILPLRLGGVIPLVIKVTEDH